MKTKAEQDEYFREYMRRWQVKRKLDAIAYKGGKCIKCGYDKNYAALVFHHRDPGKKDLNWDKLRRQKLDVITSELDKCDLLCCRCHTELHYDQNVAIEAVEWLATHKRPSKRIVTGICEHCGKEFTKRTPAPGRFCSVACHGRFRWKSVYPADDEFMKLVDEIGRVKAGKQFGVSQRAIAKRYNKISGPRC